jgi:hypothetical protein
MEQNKIIKLFTNENTECNTDKLIEERRKSIEYTLQNLFKKVPNKALNEIHYINKLYNNPSFSYVYFLYNEDTGLTKIGCTSNLLKRIKEIVTTFKNYVGIIPNLTLLGVIMIHKDEMYKLEARLHDDYKQFRTFGEWFNVDIKDLIYCNFIDSSENSILIQDTFVCVGEYNEYEYFKNINYDYTVSLNDLEKMADMKVFKCNNCIDSIINKQKYNELLDICLTIIKKNIGFKVPINYIVKYSLIENEIIIGSHDENNIQTISKIKRNNFNKEEVESAINYLISLKS